eukprot:scaffold1077_cov253-Pinguiococcus_pyrenoidosus.AAC.6
MVHRALEGSRLWIPHSIDESHLPRCHDDGEHDRSVALDRVEDEQLAHGRRDGEQHDVVHARRVRVDEAEAFEERLGHDEVRGRREQRAAVHAEHHLVLRHRVLVEHAALPLAGERVEGKVEAQARNSKGREARSAHVLLFLGRVLLAQHEGRHGTGDDQRLAVVAPGVRLALQELAHEHGRDDLVGLEEHLRGKGHEDQRLVLEEAAEDVGERGGQEELQESLDPRRDQHRVVAHVLHPRVQDAVLADERLARVIPRHEHRSHHQREEAVRRHQEDDTGEFAFFRVSVRGGARIRLGHHALLDDSPGHVGHLQAHEAEDQHGRPAALLAGQRFGRMDGRRRLLGQRRFPVLVQHGLSRLVLHTGAHEVDGGAHQCKLSVIEGNRRRLGHPWADASPVRSDLNAGRSCTAVS